LKRHYPDRPAFRILEIARDQEPRPANGQQMEAKTDRIGAAASA
jgi:hypothetical protein